MLEELIGMSCRRSGDADVACRVSISPIAAAAAQWGNDAEVLLPPPQLLGLCHPPPPQPSPSPCLLLDNL